MKKLIIIFSLTIGSLWLAGVILDTKYKDYWRPFFDKLDILFKDSSSYEVILLGNSRMHFGVNPLYVDSITKLNSYNFGMGGAPISEVNFITKAYLQNHHAPKYALISIGYGGIIDTSKYFENPCFYFFYLDDKLVSSTLDSLNYHTSLFKALPILKYTSFDDFNKFSIVENFKGKTILRNNGIAYKGFINNSTNNFSANFINEENKNGKFLQSGINSLEQIIILFKEKKSLPILLYPPSSKAEEKLKTNTERKIDEAISLLSMKYQIPIWHFDTDNVFTNNYFSDPSHLNIPGTIIYSKRIGEKLKTLSESSGK